MLAYPPEFAERTGYEGGRFLMQSALDTSRMIDSAIVFCPTTAGLGARRFDQFNGGAIEPREKSAKATARKSNNANAKTPSCSALCIPHQQPWHKLHNGSGDVNLYALPIRIGSRRKADN
jgi:hypothetical protein